MILVLQSRMFFFDSALAGHQVPFFCQEHFLNCNNEDDEDDDGDEGDDDDE